MGGFRNGLKLGKVKIEKVRLGWIFLLFLKVIFVAGALSFLCFAILKRTTFYAEDRPSRQGLTEIPKLRRLEDPADIDCEAEVGFAGKNIPLAHQYHPKQRLSSHRAHNNSRKTDTCRSKHEQHCFWRSKQYIPSPIFLFSIQKYHAHHRKCVEGIPLTEHVLAGTTPPGCQYMIWLPLDGKGNQIMSLVSAFVYSLLTDRVLLLTRGADIEHLFCEPFPDSSWLLPKSFPSADFQFKAEQHGFFYDRAMNLSAAGKLAELQTPKHLDVSLSNWHWQIPADLKFFCEGEQKLLAKIPWMFFRSNGFSIPAMYFVPSLRKKLNRLFPDRAAFLHAGRYLLSPSEQIWARVVRIYRSYMAPADRRLAIQVRAWSNNYEPVISRHIIACAIHSNVLPKVTTPADRNENTTVLSATGRNENTTALPELSLQMSSRDRSSEKISVVLTSLRREYAEELSEFYAEGEAVGGEIVTVLSPSNEGEQVFGNLAHERKAIADMWLLSFADDMISSPRSTFGYVAHGLAGIRPIVLKDYGIDKENVPDEPCARTNLPGPCFIDHPHHMKCPLDEPLTRIVDASLTVTEVQNCELQWGVGIFEEI